MAKLTIFALTLVLVFALSAALDLETLFTASSIITKQKDEEKGCQKVQLSHCQEYLRKSTKMSPYYYGMITNEGRSWRAEFPRCCDQLEQIDRDCRCDAIRQVVQELRLGSEEGEMKSIEVQEMLETAQSLPYLCRIKHTDQRCPITSAASEHET